MKSKSISWCSIRLCQIHRYLWLCANWCSSFSYSPTTVSQSAPELCGYGAKFSSCWSQMLH